MNKEVNQPVNQGEMTSREIGNEITKKLVELGEKLIQEKQKEVNKK